jgi:type IV secretory pathway TrbD component
MQNGQFNTAQWLAGFGLSVWNFALPMTSDKCKTDNSKLGNE